MEIRCKKCGCEKVVKAGKINGNQRYKCKECGCQFQPNRHKGKPERVKNIAVLLYLLGLSMRTIAKFTKTDIHAVYRWIKDFAKENYEKPQPAKREVFVELDEMWHFIGSKKTSFGFGRLVVAIQVNLSTGNVGQEILIHFQDSTNG
jgi:transposase